MPSESLWVALANTYAYCNGNAYCNGDAYCYRGAEVYADTQAASHTAASAVRPAFNGRFLRGLAINSRVPVMRTSLEEITRSAESSSSMSKRGARVAPAVSDLATNCHPTRG